MTLSVCEPGGGGGATLQSFIQGGSAPRSNPFGTLFYSLFDTPSQGATFYDQYLL